MWQDITSNITVDPDAPWAAPFVYVKPSHQVDFKMLVVICAVMVVAYLLLLVATKRKVSKNLNNIVVMIFDLYGVAVCWVVILKTYNFTFRIDFTRNYHNNETYQTTIAVPEMGADELVLIFIGSLIVATILVEQVAKIFYGPVLDLIALIKGRGINRNSRPAITSTDTHSSTPPKATSALPGP